MPVPMERRHFLFPAIALLLTACADGATPGQPVLVGGLDGEDACGGYGVLRSELDQVSVRAAPAPAAEQIDRLPGGMSVWLCDEATGWVGIVYGEGRGQDCGVATPVPASEPYAGPCKAGWIEDTALALLAG